MEHRLKWYHHLAVKSACSEEEISIPELVMCDLFLDIGGFHQALFILNRGGSTSNVPIIMLHRRVLTLTLTLNDSKLYIFAFKHKADTYSDNSTYSNDCIYILF